MKLFKILQILALVPLSLMVACNDDDDDDNTPVGEVPSVVSTNPQENDLNVSTNSKIVISFNTDMDAATLNSTNFTLKSATADVLGTVAYNNKIATFTPIDNLEIATMYTANLSGDVKAENGNSMANSYSFSFTTGLFEDNTAPTIASTSPTENATNVARNKVITVTFSESMSTSSVTESSFMLSQGGSPVTGSVEYSNNTARFIPDSILKASMSYTATITTDVQDLAGNALAITKAWTFTTGAEAGLSVVNLRSSGNYVILAKTAINNSPTSAITGDMGLSPAATSFITGFGLTNATGFATSPQVTGKIYAADMAPPTNVNLTTAVENMITAYNDAAGRPTPDYSELGSGNIGGMTLDQGLYKWTNTVTMPTDVTISGGADDVWIFQIAGDLTMSSNVNITLTDGAQAKNIFWQVAGEVILGTNSHFEGVILSMTGITLQTGASINGRALSQTAVILDSNTITQP